MLTFTYRQVSFAIQKRSDQEYQIYQHPIDGVLLSLGVIHTDIRHLPIDTIQTLCYTMLP